MAQKWFPQTRYRPGSLYSFQAPTQSHWQIEERLSQHDEQLDEADYQGPIPEPSSATATFRVRDLDHHGRMAYMGVFIQIPHLGTDFESVTVRRQQAGQCDFGEVEAYKIFHVNNAQMTPTLLAIKEQVQGDDGFVPGGFLVFMVYERVPGIRLAEDTTIYPGFPLHTFFTKFDRAERDKIRKKFDKVYPAFAEMDCFPGHCWADHLVWHSSSERLYFIDFKGAHPTYRAVWANPVYRDGKLITDAAQEPRSEHWRDWGLAIPPENSKERGRLSAWTL